MNFTGVFVTRKVSFWGPEVRVVDQVVQPNIFGRQQTKDARLRPPTLDHSLFNVVGHDEARVRRQPGGRAVYEVQGKDSYSLLSLFVCLRFPGSDIIFE